MIPIKFWTISSTDQGSFGLRVDVSDQVLAVLIEELAVCETVKLVEDMPNQVQQISVFNKTIILTSRSFSNMFPPISFLILTRTASCAFGLGSSLCTISLSNRLILWLNHASYSLFSWQSFVRCLVIIHTIRRLNF